MNAASAGDSDALRGMLRGLASLRLVIVFTMMFSAFLIQLTFDVSLPLDLIYYLVAFACLLSITSLLTVERVPAELNAGVQILGDLLVVTGLVWISGGPDSTFTFVYLAIVAAGAILLGRRGGLTAAGLAGVCYAVLVDLMYFGVLPPVAGPRSWARATLVGNVALNVAAFVATALLVSKASDKLREARADLERRKAEIARLQALHSSVLSSMSSGVLTTDLEGVITFANRAACDLLGLASVDVVGRPVLTLGLVDPGAWERLRSSDSEILRFEGIQKRPSGDAYFGISGSALRDADGRATGRVLIFQNVTRIKKLEGEVRLKEKLAAVGELAAGIAHEIRNPLASISGSVQVLKDTVPPDSEEQRLMDIVLSESQRLARILEDFLRYVRPRERSVEPVDAPAALRDVLTLLSHSDEVSPQHQVVLDLEPESAVLPADPGQLRQIFWNVARNAFEAMPAGGRLTVTARLSTDTWTAAFADDGRGMSPEERDRLFTPFAHSFPGGTGLGLAIVYRIVEEHGGRIAVDTELNRGTTVTISLPAPSADRPVSAPAPALAATEAS
ncbi:MAG TPA: ATP-binding protein [Thermoanaerobaculia bacterium]|nr:ATP-binding protein [Thermoanaerobaculia bacterium]